MAGSVGFGLEVLDRALGCFDVDEDSLGVREEPSPGIGEPHAARRSLEEAGAELVFEMLDLSAHRGLGDAQCDRGARDVALLGDRNEVADLIEAHFSLIPQIQTILDTHRDEREGSRMSVAILSSTEVARLRRACSVAAATLAAVGEKLRPGVTTGDIDAWVREDTALRGGTPSQLGYHGFPAAVCTSKNHVVCHGIPSPKETLNRGDIVNVDVTTEIDGFHGDTSATFVIGDVSPEAKHLVDVARRARDAGIAVVRDGARLGDIGAAIQELARREGCSVVRDFGGHGIGRKMHLDPHVPHTGVRGSGMRLRAGMAITIEPMINLGSHEIEISSDGWTVWTRDRRLSAQFEHTIVVTRRGADVLTA